MVQASRGGPLNSLASNPNYNNNLNFIKSSVTGSSKPVQAAAVAKAPSKTNMIGSIDDLEDLA